MCVDVPLEKTYNLYLKVYVILKRKIAGMSLPSLPDLWGYYQGRTAPLFLLDGLASSDF